MEARPPRCRRPFRNAKLSAAGLAKHPADMVAPTQLYPADMQVERGAGTSASSAEQWLGPPPPSPRPPPPHQLQHDPLAEELEQAMDDNDTQ
eukprot:2198446-Alexandrium_andersonii.AAC.1